MMAKKDTVLSKITGHQSDGCTNSPDFNFYECCAEHDWHYSKNSDYPRFLADLELALCIIKAGHPALAILYFYSVRKFGRSYYVAMGDSS
jgi:hypothetical protein